MRDVSLGDLEGVVHRLIEGGRFSSADEVLREGVRLVEEQENRLKRLDAAIAQGLVEMRADAGEPLDAVALGLIAKYQRDAEAGGR